MAGSPGTVTLEQSWFRDGVKRDFKQRPVRGPDTSTPEGHSPRGRKGRERVGEGQICLTFSSQGEALKLGRGGKG